MCMVGYAASAYVGVKVLKTVYDILFPFILGPILGLCNKLSSYCHKGEWAVVTGATDGIGKGYAKQLAKRGINVFLISRSQEKLDATKEEIRNEFKEVEIKTLAFNFNQAGQNSYEVIRKALKGLQIGLLVNNVGVAYEYPELLDLIPGGDESVRDLVVVNCLSAAMMCRIVLPEMKERGRGAIVNIASASALAPTPYLTVYSATKKFVGFLTKGLEMEYENSGIFFQCVYPFFVATKMAKIRRANFWAPNPEVFAKSAIGTIGIQTETTGYLSHAIQAAGLNFLPTFLIRKMVTNQMKALRDKAVRGAKKQ